ncbi:type II 3-dehydroquinate dehydratase [Brevibacterium sp.]|uniref:type II 3-dehydroquinate dehydratase n=1 Tax=Brevibacterium sp. TaxID=1701 RepID=UPI002811E41A|nr:type II 3-dehydroquinate dehydratase [Brevibacterium sp.]
MNQILVLNGPNLNLLGTREPEIYGRTSLADIDDLCAATAAEVGLEVRCLQSNHEGELVDAIHAARDTTVGAVVNAAAYTHTSLAIHDALKSYHHRIVEVHLSNPHARETFRHHSYVSLVADVIVAGAGAAGYAHAIRILAEALDEPRAETQPTAITAPSESARTGE